MPVRQAIAATPIRGKIKASDSAIINANSPVVVTMVSVFNEHMIKCKATAQSNCLSPPACEIILNAANDNILEEIPEAERVSFYDNKSDTFSQTEKIEAKQAVRHSQPGPHQPPSRQPEVTKLAEPIFLVAQASVFIWPHCQQWVTSTVFPTTTATIPYVIVQPLPTSSVAVELPIETIIVNITNGQCLLLFVNNMPNSIKLCPNQVLAVAKHLLRFMETHIDCQVATPAADRDLTNHKLAALDKSFPYHTDH
uniref:Uncharacterized protein n=1 Tax=Romanomermis culicivorax TaxID=13658 RepID=A0A915J6F1_ROMCU